MAESPPCQLQPPPNPAGAQGLAPPRQLGRGKCFGTFAGTGWCLPKDGISGQVPAPSSPTPRPLPLPMARAPPIPPPWRRMFSWYWMMKYSCVCCSFFSSFSVSWVTRRSSSKVWLICRCFWDMASARLLAGEGLCRERAPGQCCAPHAWGRERPGCRGCHGGQRRAPQHGGRGSRHGAVAGATCTGWGAGPQGDPSRVSAGAGLGQCPWGPRKMGRETRPPCLATHVRGLPNQPLLMVQDVADAAYQLHGAPVVRVLQQGKQRP